MTEHTCRIVSKEELVAYADGDLAPSEAERIAEHVATCPNCRAMAQALERSLQVTQVVWQTGQARWPETRSFENVRTQKWPYRRAIAVAASILLILCIGLTLRLLNKHSEPSNVVDNEPTAAEIEIKANYAELAAQMFALADFLSSQPNGEQYAMIRYSDVVTSFPDTEHGKEAQRHLQNLLKRR